MPKIIFTESAVRGNDPVFVFGSRLRQQSFTLADFALNQLNTPTPISNFSSRFSGQWSLFDGLQSWYGVSRAKYMKQAAEQQLDRTDQELVYQAVQAYYGVLLAQKQVQVAKGRTENGAGHRGQQPRAGRERHGGGLGPAERTGRNRSAQAGTHPAQNALSLARTQLALASACPPTACLEPQEALTDRTVSRRRWPSWKRGPGQASRPEAHGVGAQRAGQKRLHGQGRVRSAAERLRLVGDGQSHAGMEWRQQLDRRRGVAVRPVRRRQQAGQSRHAESDAGEGDGHARRFRDQIRLQVRKAYYDYDAARQQVEVARSAVAQADESLRINQNRYEGGLTTISDLLRVEEANQRAKVDYWEAVYRVHTSYAGVELATGTLSPSSPAVTQ